MKQAALLLAAALPASACTQASTPASTNQVAAAEPIVAPTFSPASAYTGRWTGVEGMFVDIEATDRPDRYRLTMQYDLDHRQTTIATLENDRLVFERNGSRKVLVPTDGSATGLKYLADKKDCLRVALGEGYCRD